MTRTGHGLARTGPHSGHSTDMRIDLVIRTLVLAPWLAGLAWRGTFDVVATVLVLGILAVWAVPLLRDGARDRSSGVTPGWHAHRARATP